MVTPEDEEKRVEELVSMIDRLMAEGDGHVNVSAGEGGEDMSVSTCRSSDCGTGACCQPNEEAPEDEEL